MNWGDIRSAFEVITGESVSSSDYFPESRVLEWANQALRNLTRKTHCLEKREVLNIVAGTAEYDLPSDLETAFRVTYDWERMDTITQTRLRAYDQRWRERTGKPRMYYLDEVNEKIGLYESPNLDTSYEELVDDSGAPLVAGGAGAFGFVIDSTDAPSGRPATILIDRSDVQPVLGPEGALLNEVTGNHVEVFYSAIPVKMGAAPDGVPELPGWAAPAVLYGTLVKAFSAETPLQNLEAMKAYGALFSRFLWRLKGRSFGKLPRAWSTQQMFEGAQKGVTPRLPQHIPEPT